MNEFFNNIHFKKAIKMLKDYDLFGINEKKSIHSFLNYHGHDNVNYFFNVSGNRVNLMHMLMVLSPNQQILDLLWLHLYIYSNKLYLDYDLKDIKNYINDDLMVCKHKLCGTPKEKYFTDILENNNIALKMFNDKNFVLELIHNIKQ